MAVVADGRTDVLARDRLVDHPAGQAVPRETAEAAGAEPMMDQFTFGSLFAGIGGIDLGLERAGMQCRWQVEIDEYARRVLAKHWPDVPKYEDVREVGAHNLGPVDLVAGGFPCQDISVARTHTSGGKHEAVGVEGARSGLWWEMLRIVREMGPRGVLVENVSALSTRGLDAVVGGLSEAGYDAEWEVVPAHLFGAPHARARTFVVAYPNGIRRQHEGVVFGGFAGQEIPQAPQWQLGRTVRAPHRKTPIPIALGVDDGVPRGVDDAERMTALGNAVVPQVAEWIGRRILEAEARTSGANP